MCGCQGSAAVLLPECRAAGAHTVLCQAAPALSTEALPLHY